MKYPKVMWVPFVVGQKPINYPRRAYDEDPNDEHPTSTYKIKRYHLHPGNEVARALNEYLNVSHYTCKGDIADHLRKSGFRVRWDAKKGRFV